MFKILYRTIEKDLLFHYNNPYLIFTRIDKFVVKSGIPIDKKDVSTTLICGFYFLLSRYKVIYNYCTKLLRFLAFYD